MAALLLPACGEGEREGEGEGEGGGEPQPTRRATKNETAPPPSVRSERVVDERPAPAAAARAEQAAQLLKTYYGLIEAGDYAAAYRLREPSANVTPGMFAGNFARYAEHRATIGTPSEPVAAEGWLYVEVPVQTYGQMKNGAPFGSAGTVTLRRREKGGEWRIFTKG